MINTTHIKEFKTASPKKVQHQHSHNCSHSKASETKQETSQAESLTKAKPAFASTRSEQVRAVHLPPVKSSNPHPQGSIQARLYDYVNVLSHIPRSNQNLEAVNAAADYIKHEFNMIGHKVTEQVFEADGNEYRNLIVQIGSKDPKAEVLVVGAHYDVCGDHNPGADDNASAVAGLLELSKMLKEGNLDLKDKRIELVAYANEEPPYFGTDKMGSYKHAEKLYNDQTNVKGMLALEMIGYFNDEPESQNFPFKWLMNKIYPSVGNFIAIVGNWSSRNLVRGTRNSIKANAQIDSCGMYAPLWMVPGSDFSDHRNYWKFGYPAAMVTDTAFFRNPNYHKSSDTLDTLNFDKMAEVVKGVHSYLSKV